MKQTLAIGATLQGKSFTYRIEKILGQGSFGITYLATTSVNVGGELGNLSTTMQVAIKEFFMRDINDRHDSSVTGGSQSVLFENYKRKFVREAQNLSTLVHPHIIKVLESFEANNTAYYVMEFCDGGSLDRKINAEGCLSEDVALGYFKQLSSALSYMHSNKMLHLDIKPGNVMLRANNTAVLIDFGLSKQYDDNGDPESSTSVGGGTPGYAPIEQNNYKESHEFPVTMDVYALGATLFKMLVGVRPPEASELFNEGFPVQKLRAKGVSERTIVAIEKAMSPGKAHRFPTVAAFAQALECGSITNGPVVDNEKTRYDNNNDSFVAEVKSNKGYGGVEALNDNSDEYKAMMAERTPIRELKSKEPPTPAPMRKPNPAPVRGSNPAPQRTPNPTPVRGANPAPQRKPNPAPAPSVARTPTPTPTPASTPPRVPKAKKDNTIRNVLLIGFAIVSAAAIGIFLIIFSLFFI